MNSAEQSPRRSCSQAGVRRPISRSGGTSTRTKLDSLSGTESTTDSPSLGQKSISLATLQPIVIQPRMAQLETLEAKMASIEVSLSSTPRRKKNGSLSGISLGSSVRSIPKELLASKELENLRNALRDKESIIQSLRSQLNMPNLQPVSMKNFSNNNNICANARELTDEERKQVEDRLNKLKTDVDNKRLTIKNLKMALERLDITDNIDIRIQQAELEYQLGREELNLLTLLEETRALQLCVEESKKSSYESHTLYSCVEGGECVVLRAIEVNYDSKGPKFGAGHNDSSPGLWIEWALEETGLCKGDRLIEVNGKMVLTKNRDDLTRLLVAAPDPALLVILRKFSLNGVVAPISNSSKEVAALRSELEIIKERAEEAQKTKEELRSDNIRLTHRISYLEEQVSELLSHKSLDDIHIVNPTPIISTVKSNENVTNINITAQIPSRISPIGSQHTALARDNYSNLDSSTVLPTRTKSSLSNVSSTHIGVQNGDHPCHRSISSRNNYVPKSEFSEKITYRKHNYLREKDYSAEINKKHDLRRHSTDFAKANSEKECSGDIMDQSFKKATKIVHELTRMKDSSLYEKHRHKCLTASDKYNTDILKHYNARKSTSVLDFRSEIHIGPKYSDSKSVENLDAIRNTDALYKKIQHSRSVKSLDFDSDCNSTSANYRCNGQTKSVDYTSEPTNDNRRLSSSYDTNMKPRPTPPKKPLRLSLHKTHSLQTVDPNLEKSDRKSVKRNHKGDIPIINVKVGEPTKETVLHQKIRWNYRRGLESGLENGSWC